MSTINNVHFNSTIFVYNEICKFNWQNHSMAGNFIIILKYTNFYMLSKLGIKQNYVM